MQQYKTYFKIITGIVFVAIVAFLYLFFLSPFEVGFIGFALIVSSFALSFILSAKFFIFKNKTIAWFALVLWEFCAIIILYYTRIIDNRFWPIFIIMAALACFVVGCCYRDLLSLNLAFIMSVLGTICFLWSFSIINLGETLVFVFVFFVIKLLFNIIINVLRRRNYDKI